MSTQEPRSFRVMLGLAAGVYLAWWFAVEWLLPGSFNPVPSRLAVVGYFSIALALGFVSEALKRQAETLFYLGAMLLLAHYFYLFHHNAQDINWAVGAYVVVLALCVAVEVRAWLFAMAAFSFALGLTVWLLDDTLQKTIFLPGLATILSLCLAVQLSRIRLLGRLSESADRFQSLFDATFEGVAVHDNGRIIDVNAAFAELFGYTREELLGKPVIELTAPSAHAQIGVVPASRYESAGLRKDGSEFAIEISSKPHVYQGRVLRLAAVRDMSERQRAEQERLSLIQEQSARASAQEAIRLRDEFISIASHELRTPITSLLLNLDVFVRQTQAGQSGKNVETYAARVRRQLGRMRRLIEELLDVSRLGAGPMTLMREPVDLEAVLKDVVDSLSDDLRRANCRTEIHSDGPLAGSWDRLRLEQVVENLLRNALIYGAGKPIELSLRRASDGHAVLTIRDHGIGIDKAIQERVFQRFERGVSAQHYGGLGLGLYIARQIMDAHQGTVRVESELGQGSAFTVELPSSTVRSEEKPNIGASG